MIVIAYMCKCTSQNGFKWPKRMSNQSNEFTVNGLWVKQINNQKSVKMYLGAPECQSMLLILFFRQAMYGNQEFQTLLP